MTGPAGPLLPLDDDLSLDLPQRRKVVLVLDLVESVRLMAADEMGVIRRWRAFVGYAVETVLPAHAGRLVKSLGDGLMVEFDASRQAVAAALQLHAYFDRDNLSMPDAARLSLRAGIHAAEVFVDHIDIYGSGVNLAARVAALAGPGETVITAEVRDQIVDGLDVEVSDLGECHLKHVTTPVRVYRVGPAGVAPVLPGGGGEVLAASVAVVPFRALGDGQADMLGEVLADEVISTLSQQGCLRVIARLSTAALTQLEQPADSAGRLLGAQYVVCGSYATCGSHLTVRAQLLNSASGEVLWARTLRTDTGAIFQGDDGVVPAVVAAVTQAILKTEVERARSMPLPALQSYTLFLGSVTLLHRLVRHDFERARDLLEHLAERHPRAAAPKAMLAKWHLLSRLQGWADAPGEALRLAQQWARRAIDDQPDHAFALSMDGLIMAHLGQDLDVARERCEAAIAANAQEPNAWLALGGIQGYQGEAAAAEAASQRAVELSPLDPARFLYDVFVAAGKLVAGKYVEAATAARNSIRLNAMHPASHRLLTISLALDDQGPAARRAGQALLRVDPGFTVAGYMRSYAGRDTAHGHERQRALLAAGLPP